MLNFDIQYTAGGGQHKITEQRGDFFVFDGVNVNTGAPNAVQLERNRQFWQRYGQFDMHENMIETHTNVRLNEIGVQYQFPRQMVQRYKMSDLRFNLSGRNLKVWTKNSKGDPDGSNYGSENAGGGSYSFFQAPQTRGLLAGFNVSF
jgi:hypothetical protein